MTQPAIVIGALLGAILGQLRYATLSWVLLGALLAWLIVRDKSKPAEQGKLGEEIGQLRHQLHDQKKRFDDELKQLRERIVTLESNRTPIAEVETAPTPPVVETAAEAIPAIVSAAALESTTEIITPIPASELPPEPTIAVAESAAEPEQPAPRVIHEWKPEAPVRLKMAPPPPAEPNLIERAFTAAKDWLFGGNTLVRMGIVLVFLGLAFLLRYASDRVVIPVEVRYLTVAGAALAALVLGWRLRESRPGYGLLMQGGAVAVMYLTIFAAMRLHNIIPMQAGFVLLVAVAVFAAILAVLQDAPGLAIAGSLGGFAAPILASTGGGSHVGLFTYFILLNSCILAMAWFKAWRALNLVGFFGTFTIGLAWGLRSYEPMHYASTQPFLIIFFLMFVGIGLLFARRVLLDAPDAPAEIRSGAWFDWLREQAASRRYVDGTLLFGPPLVGFSLQYALVKDTEYGAALSALALGLFYMLLAKMVFSRTHATLRLLVEVFLALGVVFGTLAIPLALDAQWTSAAWAVEAAGIYWIGHRQGRALGRAFALLLQTAAVLAWLGSIHQGMDTLLAGPVLGTLLLGLALLCNALSLRMALQHPHTAACWDRNLRPLFNTLGLWFLYLLAPLLFAAQGTAVAWSLAGLATVLIGLRLQAKGWLPNSLLVQLLAGVVFLFDLRHGGAADAVGVLSAGGSGWRGLIVASLVGVAALFSVFLAIRVARQNRDPQLEQRMGWLMLFGLVFLTLAALFVLPWAKVVGVWAGCGLIVLVLALWLALRPAFWFALILQGVAGIAYVLKHLLGVASISYYSDQAAAFAHSGFWTPAIIAMAAFLVAWRLVAYDQQAQPEVALDIHGKALAVPILIWSALWWSFAWGAELSRLLPDIQTGHAFLTVMAVTAMIWNAVARRQQWATPVWLGAAILPLAAVVALVDVLDKVQPLGEWGWLAFGLVLLAHLFALSNDDLLSDILARVLHLLGVWTGLLVLSLEIRHLLLQLAEPDTAWRWLGWVLPLVLWLLWSARRDPPQRWPAAALPDVYRFSATFPLVLILLAWVGLSALQSVGNAAPLPFIPLINPLEMAQVLVLFAAWQWLGNVSEAQEESPLLSGLSSLLKPILLGVAFVVYSMAVVRANHYIGDVAWQASVLRHSMAVQASLSLAWSLLALGLMIAGHRSARRMVWIVGAVLVAVVVAKLFLVELSHTGGVARIVSFIGVGVLLLVVGYFAPLPPAQEKEA